MKFTELERKCDRHQVACLHLTDESEYTNRHIVEKHLIPLNPSMRPMVSDPNGVKEQISTIPQFCLPATTTCSNIAFEMFNYFSRLDK